MVEDMRANGEPLSSEPSGETSAYQEGLLRARAAEVDALRTRSHSEWEDLERVRHAHARQVEWLGQAWEKLANVHAFMRMIHQSEPWIEAKWLATGGPAKYPPRVHPLIDPSRLQGYII